jgi:hypothetical protein
MGLPKAIQKEAWSDRTYRNRAGAWCPDRRGNLHCPCRLEHRTAYQRSWPPRAEVRNALGTRGSARGGELPHRGRPALGRLVASFSAGKEDGDRPSRPQGSKAPLRGDSSGTLEEGSKRTPLRPPRAGLLRGKIHLPGSLRDDRRFCRHTVRDLQGPRCATRPHRLFDGRRGRPDQRIQGRACGSCGWSRKQAIATPTFSTARPIARELPTSSRNISMRPVAVQIGPSGSRGPRGCRVS